MSLTASAKAFERPRVAGVQVRIGSRAIARAASGVSST